MLDVRTLQQFISINDLKKEGYTYYQINKILEEGALVKLNKKYYENLLFNGEPNDFYASTAYSEKGVICLLSAAIHYGLSSERPSHVDVALPRRTRIPKSPEWPTMKYYLFSEPRYELGIETINENGNIYRIYDIEKTVCDIIFYRNKIGFEPAIEVIKNYMNCKERNLNKLMDYAGQLREGSVIKQFVEVLV